MQWYIHWAEQLSVVPPLASLPQYQVLMRSDRDTSIALTHTVWVYFQEKGLVFTQLSWHCCMLSSHLPCLTDTFPSPPSLSCFCVMLWSVVFHSSDATALFPKIVLTPGQETNTVPWSALLTSWANWHKWDPYKSITDVIFFRWFGSWNTKSTMCWPSVGQYSRKEWCPVATILFCLYKSCLKWQASLLSIWFLSSKLLPSASAGFGFYHPFCLRICTVDIEHECIWIQTVLTWKGNCQPWIIGCSEHRGTAVLKCPWSFLRLAHSKPILVCPSS